MKKQKIILISILFLCIIFSIVIINHNINIEKETKTIKQMNESTQVTDLNAQINQLNISHTEYANSIQTAKKNLATAITNQGVVTSENDTFETMTTNIGNILEARTKDATATADNISEGKTAYVNGQKITGTGADSKITIITGTSNPIAYGQTQFINTGSRPKVIFADTTKPGYCGNDFYMEYNDGTVFRQNGYIIKSVTDNGFTIGTVWSGSDYVVPFSYKVILY